MLRLIQAAKLSFLLILILQAAGLPRVQTAFQEDLIPRQNVSQELFYELEELARVVDISYCVGSTGIQKPFLCASRCSDFQGFELVTVSSSSSKPRKLKADVDGSGRPGILDRYSQTPVDILLSHILHRLGELWWRFEDRTRLRMPLLISPPFLRSIFPIVENRKKQPEAVEL